jgi:hypothetical protein
MEQNNPLKQYFRQFKMFLKLPSGTTYYKTTDVELNELGEIGIKAMTGQDELILKNPDALLNGEAIIEVIKSCVPAVKNPKVLLSNDIDAIITAIRHASFGNSLESVLACPACKKENTFKLDLQYALDNMTMLEPDYVVNLENGLSIFVKPYSFPEMLKGLHAQFEQAKLARELERDGITEDEKSAAFKKAFEMLSRITFELISKAIVKIVDENAGINVTEQKYIVDFIRDVDREVIDRIQSLVKEISEVGIKKEFTATCSHCEHTWSSEIDFNPVNFS